MENYKLSALQRNHSKTGWHNSEQFNDSDIANIKVLDSRSDKSLNAIPSPLARIHLFDTAISLVYQDELYGTKNSGETYKKLVSDCFDVFELIFNWNSHIKEKKNIEIITWNRETETSKLQSEFQIKKKTKIEEIKKNHDENMRLILQDVEGYKENLVGESLNLFLSDGIFAPFDDIHIIKVDNKPLAGTSPLTGFFTTPNDLSKFHLINPLTKHPYFSKIRMFSDRDLRIKKFIYDFFTVEGENIFSDKLAISKYLERHAESINSNLSLKLSDLNSPHNSIFNNSITLKSSQERPISDYFENCLVKINFKINDDLFYCASNEKKDKRYDYLLPLTAAFFEDFDLNKIPSNIMINEKDSGTVEVIIKKDGQKLSKTYQKNKISEIDGQLIELMDTHSIKINLGIFPFVKVIDQNSKEVTEFNDFYKLMFVCQDNNYIYDNTDFKVSFGKDKTLIDPNEATLFQIEQEHRTILRKDQTLIGSTYYSTNFCFDFIKIQLPKIFETEVSGVIVPKWVEKKLGNKQVDFAVDFGTTSTFVAYTDDDNQKTLPKKFEISEKQTLIGLLNKPKEKKPEFKWIDCYENHSVLPDFFEFFEVQKQEFLPSLLNSEKYDFPFRTVVFEKSSIAIGQKKTLLNSNIAFTYQREDNTTTFLNQVYIPNLKWNIKSEGKFKESVEVFIEELFHLLRLKCLLNNGDPHKSVISWFSPLSFTPGAKFIYDTIWESKYERVFKGNKRTQLRNITESEAPFFYYSKIQADAAGAEKIEDTSAVLTLDIGGGTTDLMFFKDGSPIIGSSVHFGANILWGDGYSEFQDEKFNGIYLSIKDKINELLKSTDLKALNEKLQNSDSNVGSDEIINFWILNNDKSKVLEELNSGEYKLSYLLHFSALIYHSFKLLLYNYPHPPKCIIFTGNGSKYLDLIQSKIYIEKICGYFLRQIYDPNLKDPQIILPNSNRKEATCFGGLYQQTKKSFNAVNYLGFEEKSEVFKRYNEIDITKEAIFDRLATSFSEFIESFFEMNESPDLSFRKYFSIETNLSALKNFMLSKSRANLVTGYDKRRKIVDGGDEITDSLFFYPFVGLVYQINKLSKLELNSFTPKTIYYALSPDDENSFETSRLSIEKKPDSIFLITVDNSNPDYGEVSIIPENNALKRAMAGINSFLKIICEFDEFPDDPTQSIEIISTGKVIRENNKWVLREKIKIKFI